MPRASSRSRPWMPIRRIAPPSVQRGEGRCRHRRPAFGALTSAPGLAGDRQRRLPTGPLAGATRQARASGIGPRAQAGSSRVCFWRNKLIRSLWRHGRPCDLATRSPLWLGDTVASVTSRRSYKATTSESGRCLASITLFSFRTDHESVKTDLTPKTSMIVPPPPFAIDGNLISRPTSIRALSPLANSRRLEIESRSIG
jgi:hypothetical protein